MDITYTILRSFLSLNDRVLLHKIAATMSFEPGRQGTGYEKGFIEDLRTLNLWDDRSNLIRHLQTRSLQALRADGGGFDCYLIRYPEGSCIPPHRDASRFGSAHWRINALVESPSLGGTLRIGEEIIHLNNGDAYVFRPDLHTHEVSLVETGTRLLWTVGTLQ